MFIVERLKCLGDRMVTDIILYTVKRRYTEDEKSVLKEGEDQA